MIPVERIRGAEKLVDVYGYWPTFHDAKVLWMLLDRHHHDEDTPALEALVRAFEITDEVDPEGRLVLRHHVQVHLRFREIRELKISNFGHQNMLHGLSITDIRDWQLEQIHFAVHFVSSIDELDASFQCRTVEVVSVTPSTDHIKATPA